MKWITPAEELPDSKHEGIVAWCDGQVTYHNYLMHIRWDYVYAWSYMPQHPKGSKVANDSASHNKSSTKFPDIIESNSLCDYCKIDNDDIICDDCNCDAGSFNGRKLRT